jgi:long-chain-fatty-acid--[acyl-carrier-protein] ligase
MRRLLQWFLWCLATVILPLRYRVRITGLDKLRGIKRALVLPNHPAYVDPPMILKIFWPALRIRPMLLGQMFQNPLLFWMPKLLDAVQMPDLEQHSEEARRRAEMGIETIIAGLKAGRNHVLWPAGHAWHSDHESLGASRTLADVLAAVPDANFILVRTRGLWGSMFSYARTGQAPNLPLTLLKAVGILLANLVFFMPRRQVDITIELLDPSKLPERTREQLNPFFERWYNAPGPEQPTYVPYHFLLGPRTFDFPALAGTASIQPEKVSLEMRRQVAQLIAEHLKHEPAPSDEEPATTLEELGLDSLDRMELSLELERRFGFTSPHVPMTVGELWALASGQLQGTPPPPPPPEWFKARPVEPAPALLADTIPEAFIRRAIGSGSQVAIADSISGVVTYRRLLIGAMLLSRQLARIPSSNIGILLPAGVAADTLFFAVHLAGKLPVLLNWTTGPANLTHAAKLTELTHVITSRRFIDRAAIVVKGTEYLFLEDLRGQMGWLEKILVTLRIACAPNSLFRRLPPPNPDSPAVVLFTSGSEKVPKAVPLTHRNILATIQAGLQIFQVRAEDVIVGFLPPFHSFGLTLTTLLPALIGIRVVYHPDPTDASAIAHKIRNYHGSLICGTPAFLSYILQSARPDDLRTIRLMVSGAEQCPESLYKRAAQMVPTAQLLEGYGVTECSPVVSANLPDQNKVGSIGLPLPNVQVQVVDVQTQVPLPRGQMGMLWVAGPNVFNGYLGTDAPNPFVERGGQRWYVTGDLVKLDEDGFLWFCGRLKRFLKAGGEMISLPAIEEPLAQAYPPTEDGPQVAIEGIETPEGRHIVLFSTVPITTRQANEILQKHGLRGLMRIDEIEQLARIPTLGTGKTDYKILRQMIAKRCDVAVPAV